MSHRLMVCLAFTSALLLTVAALPVASADPASPTSTAPAEATPVPDLDGLFGARTMSCSASAECSSVTVSCTGSTTCVGTDGVGVDCGGSCQIDCAVLDAEADCKASCDDAYYSCIGACGFPVSKTCGSPCARERTLCRAGCGTSPTSCTG